MQKSSGRSWRHNCILLSVVARVLFRNLYLTGILEFATEKNLKTSQYEAELKFIKKTFLGHERRLSRLRHLPPK